MRIFHAEFAHDYGTYAFGYQVHAELSPGEDARTAYANGFLPRSNDPEIRNRFYMARSVRIPLPEHRLTSENRRVLRKFDDALSIEHLSREELAQDTGFRKLFLSYFDERHGIGIMSAVRLEGILSTPLPLRGVRYCEGGTVVGYAVEVAGDSYLHYWYPVFAPERVHSSLGMWMMLDAARRAKDEEKAHLYLGTAYGAKGRYKMNLEPLEFWDGETWRGNGGALKELLRTEATRLFARGD